MSGTPDKPRNPYVGPRPFDETDRDFFFGRSEETEILTGLVLAHRANLLFSPSGAGKSSLVRAGLVPALTRHEIAGRSSAAEGGRPARPARTYQRMRVLPILNVGRPGPVDPSATAGPGAEAASRPGDAAPPVAPNRYVLNALLSLRPETQPADLAGLTLTQALAPAFAAADSPDATAASFPARPPSTLLIFDQFEEVFTHDPTGHEAHETFFGQVAAALAAYPTLHVLFSMREEYLGDLTPYAALLPDDLRSRFRLELLGVTAARQAIQEPARKSNVDFSDAAAAKLIDDLRRVRAQRADGTLEERLGPYVEPVQLQVVCHRLWNRPRQAGRIDEADIAAVGDVSQALAEYYADTVKEVAAATGVPERDIRHWCGSRLITEMGLRGQVLQEPSHRQGLDNRAIWPLVDAHLVRADVRRGMTWFELAHDRLVDPVLKDNSAWWKQHLSAFQRQAALWEEQNRPRGLLLRDEALSLAEAWVETHRGELTAAESDFLAECLASRAAAERDRLLSQRIRRWGLVAAVAAAVALLALVGVILQTQAARSSATREQHAALTAQAAGAIAQTAGAVAQTQEALAEQGRDRAVTAEADADAERIKAVGAAATADSERAIAEDQRRKADTAATAVAEQKARAEQASLVAQSRQLAAVASSELSRHNDQRALLLAIAAYRISPTREAEEMIYQGLAAWRGRLVLPSLGDPVRGATFTPDGQIVATLAGAAVQLWDLAGRQTLTLLGHDQPLKGMVLGPSGRDLLTTSEDRTARLWDVQSGQQLWQLEFTSMPVSIAIRPDGKQAAIGTEGQANVGGLITIVDLPTGTVALTITHARWGSPDVAYSPDGALAAIYSDGVGRIWLDGTTLRLRGHTDVIRSLAFHPKGSSLATVSDDGSARLWSASTGEQLFVTQDFEQPSGPLAFSPDALTVAIGSWNGSVYLWDIADPGARTAVLPGHDAAVTSVAFSPDGALLATTSLDGLAHLWHVASRSLRIVLSAHEDIVWSACFSPDGEQLLTASEDNTARLWSVSEGIELDTLRSGRIGRLVRFAADGRSLLSVHDGLVLAWDPHGDRVAYAAGTADPLAVAVSPDLSLLADADGTTGQVGLWHLQTGGPLTATLLPGAGPADALAFAPDGHTLAVGGRDGRVHIWDVGSPTEQKILSGHNNDIFAVAFSPDGQILATGSGDGSVRLWDWQKGTLRQVLTRVASPVWALAFSGDGRLAASDEDGRLYVWDLARAGYIEKVLFGDVRLRSLAFSPDGDVLIGGAEDGVIRLWKWQTGEEVHMAGHSGWITSLSFSPDGQQMATTGHDGTVRLWPGNTEAAISLACSRVDHDLSRDEWQQAAGDVPYAPVCPGTSQPAWTQASRMPAPQAAQAELPPPSTNLPIIFYFEAVPGTRVPAGGSVVLRWSLVGARAAYLYVGEDDNSGQGVIGQDVRTFQPEASTVYRLQAISDAGVVEKVLRVTVTP